MATELDKLRDARDEVLGALERYEEPSRHTNQLLDIVTKLREVIRRLEKDED